ncbi:MAG: HAD-IIIC family phosphatase, partial [Gemmatimonadota bacterium]|nr:HAD-IIIC family phosphatase [Gemmatimonadota bacterium]
PDRTPALLARLADAIAGYVVQRVKLVISDLDDTLWGGRVGDDGYEGIELDPSGPGRHFLRMQSFLAGLQEQGVVLALASKNNRAPVEEVFEKRPEMMVGLKDFAATEIHWEPKSVSVGRILERLNLTRTGIVFLDDNPVEREEVRRQFPELIVPDLPEDPAQRVPMLVASGIFDRRVVTDESRSRSTMYAQNSERESAMASSANIDDFLRDLEMVMEVMPVDDARERVLELIQKTNQFNLTTRRYSWEDVSAITRRGFGVCYRLKDKFGDNGIISVVLVDAEGDEGRIDLWLMSCRVLGRKVEEAILADVACRARERGIRRLVGEFIPSPKNALVKDLYPKLGFTERKSDSSKSDYIRATEGADAPAGTDLIKLVERSAVAG